MKHYRFFLAAIILSLSTASAVHEVLHHNHGTDAQQVAAASTHSEHSNNCEFCAKGAAASLEAVTVGLACYTGPDDETWIIGIYGINNFSNPINPTNSSSD